MISSFIDFSSEVFYFCICEYQLLVKTVEQVHRSWEWCFGNCREKGAEKNCKT